MSHPSPTNLQEAIAFCAAHGLSVTPVAQGDKNGYLKGWSQPGHSAKPSDFRVDDNIGVLNGTEPCGDGYFFHDVDIDAPSAVERRIVRHLLPPTEWIYGRPSKDESHLGFLVKGQLRTRRYAGTDGKVIDELRGITQKKTHTLSVGPGSTHSSGERIRFCEPRLQLGRVEVPEDLDRAVQHGAVGVVISRVWPSKGRRHDLRLAFAKVLMDHGISDERTQAILEVVMKETGSDVNDVAAAVRDTANAIKTGQPTAGASVLIEVLGDDIAHPVLKAIARILRSNADIDDGKSINMVGGRLSGIVDRAEAALLDSPIPIYQRGGLLTRPIKLDTRVGDAHNVRREAGSTMLIAVREPWLLEQMGRALPWYRPTGDGKRVRADPQPIYARTLLSRGEWRFPVLRGVVTAPTLARDGRIIEAPGFDASSGLLLDIAAGSFPPVPVRPTKDDAHAALERLAAPLREFPFVDDAARSVALSGLLTALVRGSLRTSPLHGCDAPVAGMGKSLLAEMPGLLATGFRPPALSQGKSDEEDEKRLSTVLFAGDSVIHIDNCERPISGDFLCSLLTQEIVQARILGLSERRVLPSTALILASGNNLTFAGDTSRRAVICRLDAGVERPDTREFDFDCHAEVLASRPELVVAGLTILRAYVVAGRPERLTPMGSFNDWEWIRGALVWLGRADPAETRDAILDNAPRKDELLTVMDLWQQAFGTNPVEVGAVATRALVDPNTQFRDEPAIALHAKLIEVACRGGKWSGKSVGWWLRRHKDRVIGGKCFRCGEQRVSKQHWYLAARNAAEPALADQIPLLDDVPF